MRLRHLLPLVGLVGALSACASGAIKTVDPARLGEAVQRFAQERYDQAGGGVTVKSVVCPVDVQPLGGEQFNCEMTLTGNATTTFVGQINLIDDVEIEVDGAPDKAVVTADFALEQLRLTMLTDVPGGSIRGCDVAGAAALDVVKNENIACQIVAQDGREFRALIYGEDVWGGVQIVLL